jgi:hypothetical protein
MTWSEAERRKNAEECVRTTILARRDHLGLRDHEIDRAVQLGTDLWKGMTTLKDAAEHAAIAIKSGN